MTGNLEQFLKQVLRSGFAYSNVTSASGKELPAGYVSCRDVKDIFFGYRNDSFAEAVETMETIVEPLCQPQTNYDHEFIAGVGTAAIALVIAIIGCIIYGRR